VPKNDVIIDQPYLLVTSIPCYYDRAGGLWLDRLWHHDLTEHLQYIANLNLCAPALPRENACSDLARVEIPDNHQLKLIGLPPQLSAYAAFCALPRTAAILWHAIGEAQIVHSGIIGWPYPLGWISNPFAVLRRKKLVIVVESSWRRSEDETRTWRLRLLNGLSEVLGRWACRHARVAIFTQAAYRDTLLGGRKECAYVMPAVWVNEPFILNTKAAEMTWEKKVTQPVRLLFAGQMTANKGIKVLLSALRLLDARGIQVQLDLIGNGELRESCLRAAVNCQTLRLSVLNSLPYGPAFFELLQQYHALVIPSLSDEQPRILFDAYARAIPVIASNTDGLRPYVQQDRTGWLVPKGDAPTLAETIERATVNGQKLRDMGMSALEVIPRYTHKAMHRTRSHILQQHFSQA